MSKDLKVGIIGFGVGRMHIAGYNKHPNAQVVAVADLSEERLKIAQTEFGIPDLFTSADEMLEKADLDVVSVALPNRLHKPFTIKAFEAGCHVLCEKPMAMNAHEGREMMDAAEKAGKRLMINFSYRFNDQSWALKSLVDDGTLGDIYFGRTVWHRRRGIPGGADGWFGRKDAAGGGPLIDLGVHRLDLALWLMGYPQPKYVIGSTYDEIARQDPAVMETGFNVEDLAAGMITFENGATLIVEASWAANIKERELMETRLLGTKAGLVQRNVGEGYHFEAELYFEKNGAQYDMALHPPVPAAVSAQYHFIDSIVKDVPHIADGREGLIVMELLDAIYRSSQTGEPQKVEKL